MNTKLQIDIVPGHRSFCVWELYVEGEFLDCFDTYKAAERAAERLQAEHDRACQEAQ